MTRVSVYGGAMVAFAAATAMTAAASIIPNWVYYIMYPSTPGSDPFWMSLGLHKSCKSDNTSPLGRSLARSSSAARSTGSHCRPFPDRSVAWDCGTTPDEQVFCTVWRTIAFLMAAALVAELVTLIGFLVVVCGDRMRRFYGWRILVPMVEVVALLQFVAMILVTYVLDVDDRFMVPGWKLGTSWQLCTASWVLTALCGMGLGLAAYMLPPEDGYELLIGPGEEES